MVKMNQIKLVPVEAKTLSINLKVCDQFSADLRDKDGNRLADYEGYVPGFMPGDHYGDYVELDIDIDTGQITNWKVPTAAQLEAFISGNQDID